MTHGPDFFEECAERIFQEFTRLEVSSSAWEKFQKKSISFRQCYYLFPPPLLHIKFVTIKYIVQSEDNAIIMKLD